jgi:integrase
VRSLTRHHRCQALRVACRFVDPANDSLVFVGPKGGRLRRQNFRGIWIKARDEAGLSGAHLHDLRHRGNTMAAATGASLRELMERMGHSSTRAALIYQHATRERDDVIAAAIGGGVPFRAGEGR